MFDSPYFEQDALMDHNGLSLMLYEEELRDFVKRPRLPNEFLAPLQTMRSIRVIAALKAW